MRGLIAMPRIIPIRDLKDTAEISKLCHTTGEPVFITKNGYGDMVIMSIDAYEKSMFMQDVYAKLDEAEADIEAGRTKDARQSLQELRNKYGL
jgi:PHD/YefM family antitoxin component YafN of YafNO toxin-antitoxin module